MFDINIKTRTGTDGQFIATCPELSVSCQGQTEEEALNKLQSLIYFHVSSQGGAGEFDAEMKRVVRREEGASTIKVLYVPDRLRIH